MQIESTIGKVLNPIEKYSTLLGAGLELLSPNVLPLWEENITRLLSGQVHAPNLQGAINDLLATPRFKQYIAMAVGGYILKDVTGNATINKISKIVQKVGTGALVTLVAEEMLFFSTHASEGCENPNYTRNYPTEASSAPSIAMGRGYY
jgi:hypothetical protein